MTDNGDDNGTGEDSEMMMIPVMQNATRYLDF